MSFYVDSDFMWSSSLFCCLVLFYVKPNLDSGFKMLEGEREDGRKGDLMRQLREENLSDVKEDPTQSHRNSPIEAKERINVNILLQK